MLGEKAERKEVAVPLKPVLSSCPTLGPEVVAEAVTSGVGPEAVTTRVEAVGPEAVTSGDTSSVEPSFAPEAVTSGVKSILSTNSAPPHM